MQSGGEIKTFRGTVIICSADNPASQMLGGYKALTSAFHKCRDCMATGSDIQSKVSEYYSYPWYVQITLLYRNVY